MTKEEEMLKKETELLKIIKKNSAFPKKFVERGDMLENKMAEGSLSPDEHKEYLEYVEEIEEKTNRRLEAIIELSYLREKPVRQLIGELGLQPQ